MWKSVFGLFLAWSDAALAAQDSAYYPQSYGNPNSMFSDLYYREAVNVLQDLAAGEFSGLFIQYHGCVWSEYGYGGRSDIYDNEDGNGDDNNAGCPEPDGDGDENSPWYQGASQCFRPNVAFSLYGVKKGSSVKASGACTEHHFINSFFTRYGIESFGDAFNVDYSDYGAYTTCEAGDENGDQDEDYMYNGQMLNPGATSYGLACSDQGGFVTAQFAGSYCSGNYFMQVTDTLDEFNQELSYIDDCLMIYQDGVEFEDESQDSYYNSGFTNPYAAWHLMDKSVACSTFEYPERCPDPHGKKHRQETNIVRVATLERSDIPKAMPIITLVLLVTSFIFLLKTKMVKEEISKLSLMDDPMDQARDLVSDKSNNNEPWIYSALSESFSRSMTGLSHRWQSSKDALIAYAEEEEDIPVVHPLQNTAATAFNKNDDDAKSTTAASVSSKKSVASKTPSVSSKKSVPSAGPSSANASVSSQKSTKSVKSSADVGSVPSKTSPAAVSVPSQTSTASPVVVSVPSDKSTASSAANSKAASNKSAASDAQNSATDEIGDIDEYMIAPETSIESEDVEVAAHNAEVANVLLAEKGIPSSPDETRRKGLPPLHPSFKQPAPGKRFKRPSIAKVSKLFFRKRAKSPDTL